MKLSLFSIIGGTFYKFSGVPITDETLRRFEETVSNKVAEKLSTLAPLLPELIKITPELVVSEEHNGDVMVKDIILETKEMAAATTASVVMMAGDDTNEPEQAEICYHCKDGFFRDILGNPCWYDFCPVCGRKLHRDAAPIDPAVFITRHEALQLVNNERNRQDAKWGEQNHAPQYWTGILGEEYGEYCQAVNETVFFNGEEARKLGGYDNMMKELTHVAAVAVGAMEALMREKLRKAAK